MPATKWAEAHSILKRYRSRAFPRLVLPRRVEQPFDVTVQWPHDANSRKPTHFLIWRFAAIDKVDRDKNTESSRILYLRKIVTFRNLQDRLGA